jgi:PhnB protein
MHIRNGFRTLTPYPIVQDVPGMIEFMRQVFGAEETFRAVGSAGGYHCEVRVGDCMMMLGGGGPDVSWFGETHPMAFHIYVPDVDATYHRALAAGAVSLQAPANQEWGERTANVKDPSGNNWYMATFQGDNYYSEGAPTLQPYLHPPQSGPVIDFLERAFGAVEMGRASSPEGAILHSTVKIGDAAMEFSDADGIYQPMPGMFYLYVPNVDDVYRTALNAGATSVTEPADQPYGDRVGGVKDSFGNTWYLAT